MVFDSFNIEWNTTCSKADYLYVGLIAKYSKVGIESTYLYTKNMIR